MKITVNVSGAGMSVWIRTVFAPKCPMWESTWSAVVSVHFKDKVGSSSTLFQRERVGFVRTTDFLVTSVI